MQREGTVKQEIVRGVALPAELHTHEENEQQLGDEEPEELRGPQGESEGYEPDEQPLSTRGLTPPRGGADPRLAPEVLRETQERAARESQTIAGRPGPASRATGITRKVVMRLPEMDVDGMDVDQLRAALREAQARRMAMPAMAIQKAIRWNNGAEPNVGDNGEVISYRDTGSISVYSFGRRPVTFYAGQWIQLAHYMQSILHFIQQHREAMNAYVEKRLGNKSKEVSQEDIEGALMLFVSEQEGLERAAS